MTKPGRFRIASMPVTFPVFWAGSIVVPRTCPKSNAQGSMPTRADLRIGLAFVYAKTADWSVA